VQINTAIAMPLSRILQVKTWLHDWRLNSAAQSSQLCGFNSAKKTALKNLSCLMGALTAPRKLH